MQLKETETSYFKPLLIYNLSNSLMYSFCCDISCQTWVNPRAHKSRYAPLA